MAKGVKSSAQDAKRLALQEEALKLRIAGLKLRPIADRLGINHQTAKNYIDAAMERSAAKNDTLANEYRALLVERNELMFFALYPKIVKGDIQAIAAAVKVNDQQARLTGAYMQEGVVQGISDIRITIGHEDKALVDPIARQEYHYGARKSKAERAD